MNEEKEASDEEKKEEQKALDYYRKTGKAYVSEEDLDIDFSKVDKPKSENSGKSN